MIQLIATAAVISCADARDIVHRIDSTQFSRREYHELVSIVKDAAPRWCHINPQPGLFRGQVRRRNWMHPRPYYVYPSVRLQWRF